jgi:Fe2+ or Zn2+ uptake regulation protein
VKRQTGAKQHRDQPAEEPIGGGQAEAAPSLVKLSDEQKTVLDCLQQAETGLTAKQIVARVSCSAPAVEDALAVLLARNLVAKLNTLIPSYACKYPGVRLYSD